MSANFGQTRPNGSPRITTNPEPNQPFNLFEPQVTLEDSGPSLRERVNEILLPDQDTIPDDSQTDMGNDPCCGEARELWYAKLAESRIYPGGDDGIIEGYDAMSCEELEEALRDFSGDAPGKYFKTNVTDRKHFSGGYLPPTQFHHDARQVLEQWDSCKFKGQGGKEAQGMGFYASDDAMEEGWGLLSKGIVDGECEACGRMVWGSDECMFCGPDDRFKASFQNKNASDDPFEYAWDMIRKGTI